jgi:hypothetical protein
MITYRRGRRLPHHPAKAADGAAQSGGNNAYYQNTPTNYGMNQRVIYGFRAVLDFTKASRSSSTTFSEGSAVAMRDSNLSIPINFVPS